ASSARDSPERPASRARLSSSGCDAWRQQLQDVIVKNDDHHQQQERHADLNDSFLDPQAQVASHHKFDQKQQHHSAVENRYREQVDETEIQADRGGQRDQRRHPDTCRLARGLDDSYRTIQLFQRSLTPEQPANNLKNQGCVFRIHLNRLRYGIRKSQFDKDGGRLNGDTDDLFAVLNNG